MSLVEFCASWESPSANEITLMLIVPHICFTFLFLLEFFFEVPEAVDTACLEGVGSVCNTSHRQ